jgi:phosphoribosylformylglycinamidine synthase
MPNTPRALVIRTAGTNCDAELCRAFMLAGAEPDLVHLDALIKDPARIDAYDLIGFPGGFSYGDDVASGRLFALRVRERLYPALRAAIDRAVPMIGVCNGFQVLVQVGLLPGPPPGETWPDDEPPAQSLSLTENAGSRFVDDWVGVQVERSTVCVWTRDLTNAYDTTIERDILRLPCAHAEGRLVADSPDTVRALEHAGQVALRYTDNFNGSVGAIAGVTDASGRILGLMPHPERYLDWNRHPYWTRLETKRLDRDPPGLLMFKSAVEAATTITA